MSGRAGRRGLDDKGIVILMIDEKVSADGVKVSLYLVFFLEILFFLTEHNSVTI